MRCLTFPHKEFCPLKPSIAINIQAVKYEARRLYMKRLGCTKAWEVYIVISELGFEYINITSRRLRRMWKLVSFVNDVHDLEPLSGGGNAAYINVVVVPQRSKSPEVRLHPLSDPLPHRRARPPRDPNSKTVAWLPSPWGTKGCTHPPSLPVGASIINNSSNSLWQVLNSIHSSSILQYAPVMTRAHLIHPSGRWPRNNSLHNSCVR